MSKGRRQVRTPRLAASAASPPCSAATSAPSISLCVAMPPLHPILAPLSHPPGPTQPPTTAGLPALLDFYRRHYFLPASEVPRSVAIADPSEYFVAQAVATAGGRPRPANVQPLGSAAAVGCSCSWQGCFCCFCCRWSLEPGAAAALGCNVLSDTAMVPTLQCLFAGSPMAAPRWMCCSSCPPASTTTRQHQAVRAGAACSYDCPANCCCGL